MRRAGDAPACQESRSLNEARLRLDDFSLQAFVSGCNASAERAAKIDPRRTAHHLGKGVDPTRMADQSRVTVRSQSAAACSTELACPSVPGRGMLRSVSRPLDAYLSPFKRFRSALRGSNGSPGLSPVFLAASVSGAAGESSRSLSFLNGTRHLPYCQVVACASVIPFPQQGQAIPTGAGLAGQVRTLANADSMNVRMDIPHFQDRMVERDIDMRSVLEVLRKGRSVGPPELD